jgi:hypothetical protein
MAQRHGHICRVANHHNRTAAAFHWHHGSSAGISTHKGIMHFVITQTVRVERSLVARAPAYFVEFSPAQAVLTLNNGGMQRPRTRVFTE